MKKLKLPGRAKRPKIKFPKIPSAWRLFWDAFADFRHDWKRYVLILAVVTVPISIANLFSIGSSDQLAGSYLSLFSIITNVAVIWAMVQREKTGTVSKLGEAYYDGSAALVRFLLITLTLVSMLLPAALGIALYLAALTAQDASGISGPEIIGVGIVALALAAPSFYLVVRYVLAPFGAVRDGLRPIAALRRSRLYTLGRFWPLAGRYFLLLIFLTILGLPLYLVSSAFNLVKQPGIASFVFGVLATLILLPVGNLFMLRTYRALEHSFNAGTAEEIEGITAAAKPIDKAA